MRFNLLLIDCVKTKGFKHTVFSISMLNYKLIKEVISGKKTFEEIFKADAIIAMDDVASEAFKLFEAKIDSKIIKTKIL